MNEIDKLKRRRGRLIESIVSWQQHVEENPNTNRESERGCLRAIGEAKKTMVAMENKKQMANRILQVANNILASKAEQEVERLLKRVLSNSKWKNKVFSVGGYERDRLLNVDSKDLDLVVEKKGGGKEFSFFLHNLFPSESSKPYEMGAGYPIWHIAFKEDVLFKGEVFGVDGAELDIVDTQKEAFPDPNTRQRVTTYGDLKEDIARRDFTVNMLLRDMSSGEIKDLTGTSKSDIERGLLREHPGVDIDKMFSDDPLRMMRLLRFQVKYGWDIPIHVIKSVKRNSNRIKIISNERIRDELVKIMKLGKLRQAVRLMKTFGLLKYILPEIESMRGVEHDTKRGIHLEGDVYKHTMEVLKHAKPTVEAQLSALLHDVGKPKTQSVLEDKMQYLGHEKVGEEIAEAILRRLKFDNNVIKRVKNIVRNHMRPHDLNRGNGGAKGLRRFIRKVGDETVDAILDLAEADALGTLPPDNYIPEFRKKIEEVRSVPIREEPVLSGREIMEVLNVKPGKIIGEIKEFLRDLEDEFVSDGKKLTKREAVERIKTEFGDLM